MFVDTPLQSEGCVKSNTDKLPSESHASSSGVVCHGHILQIYLFSAALRTLLMADRHARFHQPVARPVKVVPSPT